MSAHKQDTDGMNQAGGGNATGKSMAGTHDPRGGEATPRDTDTDSKDGFTPPHRSDHPVR